MSQEVSPSRLIFSQCVRHIRTWEDAHLPLSQSRIAFDLFMLIGHSSQIEHHMTLKELFNSLKYSERGVRYVLEQFVDGGWCHIVGHEQDKRFRLVVASKRLTDKLAEYEKVVLSNYRSSYLTLRANADSSVRSSTARSVRPSDTLASTPQESRSKSDFLGPRRIY